MRFTHYANHELIVFSRGPEHSVASMHRQWVRGLTIERSVTIEWSNEGPAVMLDEGDYLLLYRAELQEQYRQSILKRKPRFLPYKECAKWVQAMNLWDTQEEWDQWIANGEKRNPYIPSRPDEYYGKFGKWRGWHFFLHGKMDNIDESQPQQDS